MTEKRIIYFPDSEILRKELYLIMLDLPRKTKLTNEELLMLCLDRGLVERANEVQKKQLIKATIVKPEKEAKE